MNEFGASCYEHGCSILGDKDVLEEYIPESINFYGLKRWWYNLFLLSYTDKRALHLYKSSHGIRKERSTHLLNYVGSIHPLSHFCNYWERLLLFVLLVNKMLFFHNTMDTYTNLHRFYYYIAVPFESIIIFDLFISMKTGYIDRQTRKVVLDSRELPLKFCSTKLFLHAIGAIPLGTLLLVRYWNDLDCEPCKANYFVCTLSLLSPLSMFRIVQATDFLRREKRSFWLTNFTRLFRTFIISMFIIVHLMNANEALTILMVLNTGAVDDSSLYASTMAFKYRINVHMSKNFFFSVVISRIFKILFTEGYGLQPQQYYLDQISTVVTFFVANIFVLQCMLEVFGIITRMNFFEDQWILSKDRTINKLRCRQLSDIVSYKVDCYFAFKMSRFKSVEKMNCLYQALPQLLQREIFLTCHLKYISKIPIFSKWPENLVEQMALLLKEEVVLAGDVVSNSGSQGEGLVIIFAGVVVVFSTSGDKLGHLIDGDYFGEISLVTDKEIRMSTVLAITNCELLILEKGVFRNFMKQHSDLFFELKKEVRERIRSDNNQIAGKYWSQPTSP